MSLTSEPLTESYEIGESSTGVESIKLFFLTS